MCKVLVIDDNKDLLDITKSLLIKRGFEVETGINLEHGLEKIKQFNPRLILLDVFLNGINGLEICKQLKTSHIPVVVCSAYPQIADSAMFEYGADDFISKPFELNDLILKMHSVLSQPAALA